MIRARQGKCNTGEAVITSAGRLKAKYVIHTVGPVWNGGDKDEDMLLGRAYRNSLQLARAHSVQSMAFPNISTGIYGFPKDRAAKIAITEVNIFLNSGVDMQQIVFCCFDEENYEIYKKMLG